LSRSAWPENLTSDAHLAALAIEHGGELCSADTDFARFAGLRWANPLGAGS
jgi:predicted nucleic acid-binding protein